MPEYVRAIVPGGTFFFTVVTNFRRPILTTKSGHAALSGAFQHVQRRHPFEIDALVVLPDHLHCIWTLPDDDTNFSTRWRLIKSEFTKHYRHSGGPETGRSRSRVSKGERGVWQRRFWEHAVCDETEYERLCNYIHYNPVRHRLAKCPHEWAFSSFNDFVRNRRYESDWQCVCRRPAPTEPDFADVEAFTGELSEETEVGHDPPYKSRHGSQ